MAFSNSRSPREYEFATDRQDRKEERQDRDEHDEARKTYEQELEKLHREFDGGDLSQPDEIDLTQEFSRAAGNDSPRDDGGNGDDRGRAPASEPKIRRRRKRKRGLDRGR